MPQNGNFANDYHALLTGMTVGFLMRHGVSAEPTLDTEGNYQPVLKITMEDGPTAYLSVIDPGSIEFTFAGQGSPTAPGSPGAEGSSSSPD